MYLAMMFFKTDEELEWEEERWHMLSQHYPWMEGSWETSSFGLSNALRRAVQMLTEPEQVQLGLNSTRITDLGSWKRYELAYQTSRIDCVFLHALKVPVLGPRHPAYIPELGGSLGVTSEADCLGKRRSDRNFEFVRRCTQL